MTVPSTRRTGHLPVLALLGALAASGCAAGASTAVDPSDGVPAPVSLGPVGTAAPVDDALRYPLTGLPAEDAGAARRPVVAVAVRSVGTSPQAQGLDRADVVYVSFPAADRQRSVALFHSRDSDAVGPVAAVRPLDPGLLRVVRSVLVHAGGTSGFLKQVASAGLPEWSTLAQPSSFERDDTGAAYVATQDARDAEGATPAPLGLLPFAPEPATGDAPDEVRLSIPGQETAELAWDADGGAWRGTVGDLRLAAANVLVQEVATQELVIPKTGGTTERSPDLEDEGRATLLIGPQVQDGSWNRPGRGASLKYVLEDGTPARLSPGTTWVLLVPRDTEVDA